MESRTAIALALVPIFGLSAGGWDGFLSGILIAGLLYGAARGMAGNHRTAFIGWCFAVCGLAGVSHGGWWSEAALTWGFVGVLAAHAILYVVAQIDWYLHEGK